MNEELGSSEGKALRYQQAAKKTLCCVCKEKKTPTGKVKDTKTSRNVMFICVKADAFSTLSYFGKVLSITILITVILYHHCVVYILFDLLA